MPGGCSHLCQSHLICPNVIVRFTVRMLFITFAFGISLQHPLWAINSKINIREVGGKETLEISKSREKTFATFAWVI